MLKCKYINTNCITGIIQDITIQKNIENKYNELKLSTNRINILKEIPNLSNFIHCKLTSTSTYKTIFHDTQYNNMLNIEHNLYII